MSKLVSGVGVVRAAIVRLQKVANRPPGGWLAIADLDDRKRIGRPSAEYRTSRPAVD
ncbi:MAG: hypothetical protein FWE95_05010 [Planctomycetaceae bacterium]|nr:hypothetical protein [Planctomycetaceae bacterium]